MASNVDRQAIASRRVVYRIDGMESVVVRRDMTYRAADGSVQPIDVYLPPSSTATREMPAVLMVTGYPDVGVKRLFGRHAKDMGSNVSWAELIAMCGVAAVTYVNTDPANDAVHVLEHLRANGAAVGIDGERLALWSCSGNVPTALSLLMLPQRAAIRCAAILYGCMLDSRGSTIVAEQSKMFGFANPTAGKSVADLPAEVPMFVARAGRDEMPRLNEALDRFVVEAIARNLPIVFANHHNGLHAFDVVDDGDASHAVIGATLAFLRHHLLTHTPG
jgi:hypothetical protein